MKNRHFFPIFVDASVDNPLDNPYELCLTFVKTDHQLPYCIQTVYQTHPLCC